MVRLALRHRGGLPQGRTARGGPLLPLAYPAAGHAAGLHVPGRDHQPRRLAQGRLRPQPGFPLLRSGGGGREWNRSLGAIVGIFQGSGGFDSAKRTSSIAIKDDQDRQLLQLSTGFALQVGYGASFGGGPFKVFVTIGIYAIAEGDALVAEQTLQQLVLAAAVGILVRGRGELDWWIISISVEVTIEAEARTQIAWCNKKYDAAHNLPAVQPIDEGKFVVTVDFFVQASVRAEACLGSGWFKVCKGIDVSVGIGVRHSLTL